MLFIFNMLKSPETITGANMLVGSIVLLKSSIAQNTPGICEQAMIFYHENARPHVARSVNNYLENNSDLYPSFRTEYPKLF